MAAHRYKIPTTFHPSPAPVANAARSAGLLDARIGTRHAYALPPPAPVRTQSMSDMLDDVSAPPLPPRPAPSRSEDVLRSGTTGYFDQAMAASRGELAPPPRPPPMLHRRHHNGKATIPVLPHPPAEDPEEQIHLTIADIDWLQRHATVSNDIDVGPNPHDGADPDESESQPVPLTKAALERLCASAWGAHVPSGPPLPPRRTNPALPPRAQVLRRQASVQYRPAVDVSDHGCTAATSVSPTPALHSGSWDVIFTTGAQGSAAAAATVVTGATAISEDSADAGYIEVEGPPVVRRRRRSSTVMTETEGTSVLPRASARRGSVVTGRRRQSVLKVADRWEFSTAEAADLMRIIDRQQTATKPARFAAIVRKMVKVTPKRRLPHTNPKALNRVSQYDNLSTTGIIDVSPSKQSWRTSRRGSVACG